jgi:enoyl reductase-like protein
MNTTKTGPIESDITVTRVLASLLERMEHSQQTLDAGQYQSVVKRLAEALADAKPGEALGELLAAHPAAAQVYENIYYQYAGLCRSALEPALTAENEVKQLIDRVKRRVP